MIRRIRISKICPFRLLWGLLITGWLLILIPGVSASAMETRQVDSLFSAGNKYYMSKQYTQAVSCYSRIIRTGFSSASLYFNLGNAYYKLNDFSRAILYYEKAKLLDPSDDDIRQNLAISNAHIVDKINAIPEFFLKRWINTLEGRMSPNGWALFSIILFAFMLFFLYLYITSHKYGLKKFSFTTGIVLLLLTISGILLMQKRNKEVLNRSGAIIMAPVVDVKGSPDKQGTSVFVLHEGTKINQVDSVEHWKEVRIADGNQGWVPDSVLDVI